MDLINAMDIATAALVLQLQIDDTNDLFEALIGKGKQREGDSSDSQIAFQLYKEDLERNAAIVADRKMSNSVAQACQLDGDVLVATLSQEQTAAGDRDMACTLGGVAAHCPLPPWTVGSEFLNDEVLEKLKALYVSSPVTDLLSVSEGESQTNEDGVEDVPESSAWALARRPAKSERRQCTACQEQVVFFDVIRAPCNHEYCRACLRDLFQASLADDSLFPPRCCRKPITIGGGIRIFLTSDLIRCYEQKKIEFDTPDRTYCSNPSCSAFIRAENITNEQALCTLCQTSTCTICKAANHGGDCPEDVGLQQALEAARENGWQRCYNCRRLVELDVGCNHITCTCQSQFCYLCGERWKTCSCEQWTEARLYARANQVVAREPARANAPLRRARIAAVAQNLRDRHNCDHDTWRYVRGSHQCEECYHTLPNYIFECQQCNIQVCNRCRNNRI